MGLKFLRIEDLYSDCIPRQVAIELRQDGLQLATGSLDFTSIVGLMKEYLCFTLFFSFNFQICFPDMMRRALYEAAETPAAARQALAFPGLDETDDLDREDFEIISEDELAEALKK